MDSNGFTFYLKKEKDVIDIENFLPSFISGYQKEEAEKQNTLI